MKRLAILLPCLLMGIITLTAQEGVGVGIRLEHLTKDKTKLIWKNTEIRVLSNKIAQDGKVVVYEYWGKLKLVNQDSLLVLPHQYEIHSCEKDGTSTTTTYNGSFDNFGFYVLCDDEGTKGELPIVGIPKSDVAYISKEGNSGWRSTGIALTSISVISALVVSPLASINYKTGEFNERRYYKMAGFSLATLTVSIPMIVFSRNKTYYVSGEDAEWRF